MTTNEPYPEREDSHNYIPWVLNRAVGWHVEVELS